jgi:hypothetical protein
MSTAATVAEATSHLEPLISDLGLSMTAGIAVLLFKKNKTATCFRLFDCGILAGNHFLFPISYRIGVEKRTKTPTTLMSRRMAMSV